jgi:hypothetical protein
MEGGGRGALDAIDLELDSIDDKLEAIAKRLDGKLTEALSVILRVRFYEFFSPLAEVAEWQTR